MGKRNVVMRCFVMVYASINNVQYIKHGARQSTFWLISFTS